VQGLHPQQKKTLGTATKIPGLRAIHLGPCSKSRTQRAPSRRYSHTTTPAFSCCCAIIISPRKTFTASTHRQIPISLHRQTSSFFRFVYRSFLAYMRQCCFHWSVHTGILVFGRIPGTFCSLFVPLSFSNLPEGINSSLPISQSPLTTSDFGRIAPQTLGRIAPQTHEREPTIFYPRTKAQNHALV